MIILYTLQRMAQLKSSDWILGCCCSQGGLLFWDQKLQFIRYYLKKAWGLGLSFEYVMVYEKHDLHQKQFTQILDNNALNILI